MIRYNYVPEDQLSEKTYEPLRDGTYKFEVININCDPDKDARVDLVLEGNGKSGRKSVFLNGENKLWLLVAYLKSIDRMDLYGKSGELDLFKTVSHIGTCSLVTRTKDGKEYQNVQFVPWNDFNEKKSVPHHVQQASTNGIDPNQDDPLDGIPF